MTTVGGMTLAITANASIGATSATLTASWTYPTVTQLVTFSGSQQRSVTFTKNSTAISWPIGLLTATTTTTITTLGVQAYPIPANISKIKDDTISVGQLKFRATQIFTRQEWNDINFLPYTSDIPRYFFITNGNLEIFPIPSTTGNILTINYKTRVADLSFADYSTGNINTGGMVAGSYAITGLATAWSATGKFPTGTDLGYYNLNLRADPPYGDGIWYPISTFTNDTTLTLALPVVNAPNITSSTTYTIGQFPLLSEDFHDMLVFGALLVYFSSIVKDTDSFRKFEGMYKERLTLLGEYAGTKATNVDLEAEPNQINPNLFVYSST